MKWGKSLPSLFIAGIKDFQINAELRSFLKEYPVSGISFFNSPHDSSDSIWNDPDSALERVYEFVKEVGSLVSFFAVDQEGGRVQRLKSPYIKIPPAGLIGEYFRENSRPDLIFQLYKLAAKQLSLSGVRLNFAPVCDLRTDESHSVIGDRSFGTRPMDVISLVKLFCESMSSEGVATTLKHFPGHGPSRFDSHERPAVIEKDPRDYLHEDQFIFEECAPGAFAVMTAHVALPDKPDRILSLDKEFLRKSREKMPENLIWMTDDLVTMKAVSERKPWITCIDAGYDFLNVCGTLDQNSRAIEESIRHVEALNLSFAEEQKLEVRCRHCHEYFEKPNLLPFKKWKAEILELSERALEILEAEPLIEKKS